MCRLHACYKDYAQLAQHVPVLIGQLSAATSLTSLTLSSKDIQQLGTLKWAHQVAQQHKSARKHSQPSAAQPHPGRQQRPAGHDKWYRGQYAAFAADSRHQVYWIPDWLATAPGLKKLAIQPPTASAGSSRWPSFNPCLPACLWLHPKPWASKLTSLEVHNVPLTATLPPTIPRLVQLKTLALVACCLQPSAVEQLFKGLAKGAPRLQVLILSQNDLWQLPQEDWHALLELQELDLSSNQLILLPAGMSQLTTLTALHLQHNQLPSVPAHLSTLWNLSHLDLSHNWLSGLRDTPHFSALLSSWRQLRVLRLENVSDKRGGLKLPAELQQCEGLRELTLGHQFSLDWSSLQLLSCCKVSLCIRLSCGLCIAGMSRCCCHWLCPRTCQVGQLEAASKVVTMYWVEGAGSGE
eukprot:GHRR01023169.1.p1 GENE.GHRR01023169.1~~GHRR01023169.1.p1  ORF type:complete len:409 (+),score=93.64 GHRR01023169.1:385-1611(+)